MSVHVSEISIRSEQTNMILDPRNILLREYDAPNMNNNITCIFILELHDDGLGGGCRNGTQLASKQLLAKIISFLFNNITVKISKCIHKSQNFWLLLLLLYNVILL